MKGILFDVDNILIEAMLCHIIQNLFKLLLDEQKVNHDLQVNCFLLKAIPKTEIIKELFMIYLYL
jgi:hypothetical protein